MPEDSGIGARIKIVREDVGLSQTKFAEVLNVTNAWICSLESGKRKNVSKQFVENLCFKFGVSRDWLMDGTGEMRTGAYERVVSKLWTLVEEDLEFIDRYIEIVKSRGRGEPPPEVH